MQYSQDQVDQEIAQVGSRFYPSFATDIYSILDNVFSSIFSQKTGNNGNLILSIRALRHVGENGILAIDQLNEEEKYQIVLRNNRGLEMMHLKVDHLPPTNAYVLILKPTINGYDFITAFPGDEGMPLPYDTLPKEYREECKAYWDRHVFLEINKNSNT